MRNRRRQDKKKVIKRERSTLQYLHGAKREILSLFVTASEKKGKSEIKEIRLIL
jgi:hypothetical protein